MTMYKYIEEDEIIAPWFGQNIEATYLNRTRDRNIEFFDEIPDLYKIERVDLGTNFLIKIFIIIIFIYFIYFIFKDGNFY